MTNTTLLKLCIWLCQKCETPIDALRQQILVEALKGVKLKNIRIEGFSHRYIAQIVAPNLWKLLGKCCNQKVTIRRLHMVLNQVYQRLTPDEKIAVEQVEILVPHGDLDDDFDPKKRLSDISPSQITQNHNNIPESALAFYNQNQFTQDLAATLQAKQHSLIFIYGGGGMGKTAGVSQMFQRSPQLLDSVLWCNLSDEAGFQENFEFICDQWDIADNDGEAIATLRNHLQKNPRILVFDHWELLFEANTLSGVYQPQYQDYGALLQQLAQARTKGTVIIITREISPFMEASTAAYPVVTSLTVPPLDNVAARKILAEYELQHPELWPEFLQTYQGNPLNLRLICNAIKHWYGGSMETFQQQNTVIGGDTLREILQELIRPTNSLERKILNWLMLWGQPITLEDLQQQFIHEVVFPSEVWDEIRSLERRFLIEKNDRETPCLIVLQPSIHRYLTQRFVQECSEEICQAIAANYTLDNLHLLRDFQLSGKKKSCLETSSDIVSLVLKTLLQRIPDRQRLKQHLAQLKQAAVALPSTAKNHYLYNLDLLHYCLA
ncbi:MAG: hypothetical protein HC799_07545 [Limnothrix sp. RL_2_0]|nr:hypothetical protein [Limnothrix sp. RL_2_0]